jgi:xanthine dehydrogenase accessory factor
MRPAGASNQRIGAPRLESETAPVRIRSPGGPVKHWVETAAILDRLSSLVAGGNCAALATVVRISGSAYRRPGAKLLIEESGVTQGGVSGGCLEADVRGQALKVLRGGPPRMLHYETSSDEETLWGLGLGCEGAVDVFVQRIDPAWMEGPGKQMRELASAGVPFAPITLVRGPLEDRTLVLARGVLAGSTGSAALDRELSQRAGPILEGDGGAVTLESGEHAAFVDVLRPPPRLFIFGAGDDARPLASLAATAGFEVTVVDHRPAYLTPERFPPPLRLALRRPSDGVAGLPLSISRRNFAVVQTHALVHDRDWMQALADQPLAYVGLLGPRVRREEVLGEAPVDPAKVFAPIGLDIGADGPEQVAVSIVAELLAVNARRQPIHLRARSGGIHDR